MTTQSHQQFTWWDGGGTIYFTPVAAASAATGSAANPTSSRVQHHSWHPLPSPSQPSHGDEMPSTAAAAASATGGAYAAEQNTAAVAHVRPEHTPTSILVSSAKPMSDQQQHQVSGMAALATAGEQRHLVVLCNHGLQAGGGGGGGGGASAGPCAFPFKAALTPSGQKQASATLSCQCQDLVRVHAATCQCGHSHSAQPQPQPQPQSPCHGCACPYQSTSCCVGKTASFCTGHVCQSQGHLASAEQQVLLLLVSVIFLCTKSVFLNTYT